MKSKWKKKKDPRPTSTMIRGNNRQMLKVHIRDMISEEEETDYGTGYGVSAPRAGGHGTAHAA